MPGVQARSPGAVGQAQAAPPGRGVHDPRESGKQKFFRNVVHLFAILQLEELWEGEEIVYKCKNDTLVINNNPDQKTVKYKCRVSGRYNSPDGDEVG